MKVVTIHSDSVTYKPIQKAIKTAEEVDKKAVTVKECLVALTSVEKKDEDNVDGVSERLVSEILKICEQVKTKTVVLYPYAHLSAELSSPEKALEVLKKAEALLKKEKGTI